MPSAVLPAASVQSSLVTFTATPSPLVVLDWTRSPADNGNAARQAPFRPLRPSLALNRFVTSTLNQPARFGELVAPRSVIVGFVLSTLKLWLAAPAAAVLPARSVNAGLSTLTAEPSPLLVESPVLVDAPTGAK